MIIKLFENYNKTKEISKLSNDILEGIAIKFRDEALEYKKIGKVGFIFIPPYYLHNIDYSKYDILSDFIKNTQLVVKHSSMEDEGIVGNYYNTKNNNTPQHYINIFYNPDKLLSGLNKIYKDKVKNDALNEYYEYYFDLYLYSHKILIHELQHAYDSYRSNNKFVSTKYKKNLSKAQKLRLKEKTFGKLSNTDLAFIKKTSNEYLSIPHEVNARYTQAIDDVTFYDIGDITTGFGNFVIRDFSYVLNDFEEKFGSWWGLDDKIKKRLKNRLYKDWGIASEIIEKENLESKKDT